MGESNFVKPRYAPDEIAFGIAMTLAVHALCLAPFLWKKMNPESDREEAALVSKPVIAATLLKLGKPIDPRKLPDRLVPRARTAPNKDINASPDDPANRRDGGPPPPRTEDDDITRLIEKSDPFAEKGGKDRPEEGHENGILGGTETDPNKVRAGDMYAAQLGAFFHERWQYPTVITQGQANRLCTVFQINIGQNMIIWHVKQDAVRKSGNDLFDDSARTMLQKLLDDRTPLPMPPPEAADQYKGRTVNLALSGDLLGDSSRCK